jgi:DMSO/TMAO reductase YedYZ molybdopterin-dependent catalytic subunit
MNGLSRRKWITAGLTMAAGGSGLAVAARLARQYGLVPPDHGGIYGAGETLTYAAQRLLTRRSMAREFSRSQISTTPYANGKPLDTEVFRHLKAAGFADWRVEVKGLVAHPTTFSTSDLRRFPQSSQITHLACEEGWSFIAEWIGVPLEHVLKEAGILPPARYVVFHSLEEGHWDSVDMSDALHPQTLVTYGMNGGDLPVPHGGPLRIRVPRQLGYKSVKWLNRITVADSLKGFGKGLGSGDAEDGYSWYAGI